MITGAMTAVPLSPRSTPRFAVSSLTTAQVEKFNEDGFLILENFLGRQEVKDVLRRFEPLFSGEFETGIWPDKIKWQKGDPEDVPRSLCNVWKSDRTVARVILGETIGKLSAQLMGWPGTRSNQDTIFWVPPGAGTTSIHQDNSYQDWHLPGGVITCWISLSDATAQGGTLEYVRGSHKWPLGQRVAKFAGAANYRSEVDAAAARVGAQVELVPVVVPPGGAAFHGGGMWHGANFNRSDQPRCTLATHCMSSESRFHPVTPSPVFSHYKRFGDLTMDESFFPVLWTANGRRSQFLDSYLSC